jgi:ribulose-5-phosphate 4-epimerase/fuculose-1-phosphate aldolase
LGALDPASLAKLDSNGIQVSGDKASKTISLHKNIYEASRKINLPAKCVIHTHSTYCVAASIFGYSNSELLPPITPYFVMKVGHVPLIPYHKPGDATVAKLVSETIVKYADLGKPIRSVMLSKLGPNVWHSSLGAAMATLEELEETAKLWILSNQAAPSLTQNEIQDLKTVFHCSW